MRSPGGVILGLRLASLSQKVMARPNASQQECASPPPKKKHSVREAGKAQNLFHINRIVGESID